MSKRHKKKLERHNQESRHYFKRLRERYFKRSNDVFKKPEYFEDNPLGYVEKSSVRGRERADLRDSRSVRPKIPQKPTSTQLKDVVWSSQFKAEVCHRRRLRRRALFASRKAGSGVGGPKKKKYTYESEVKC